MLQKKAKVNVYIKHMHNYYFSVCGDNWNYEQFGYDTEDDAREAANVFVKEYELEVGKFDSAV